MNTDNTHQDGKSTFDETRKRVTIYMDIKHKRFLEDFAHEQRITQYEALRNLFEKYMRE